MSNRLEFTESYEVNIKSKGVDETLIIGASSSDQIQDEDKSRFLKMSAILELRKMGKEIDGNMKCSFKRIEP